MGLRDTEGFEQMTSSGPVPVSEARQNGARRHSHSFRPLHDVGGFKAAQPTLPQKEPRGNTGGMMVYLFACLYLLSSLPSLVSPSPTFPPPRAQASCQWEYAEALHSVTRTKWRAEGGEGWIERSECGVSWMIRPRLDLRRSQRHQEKQREGERADMG